MAEETKEKIRLLIVDDIPETIENLKKLLYFEPDIEVVGSANNGQQAIESSKSLRPDIVLMDINLPDLDGIQAAEQITAAAPRTQIIMMSVQSEADYLRRSMLAGAREFLTKPFSSDELITAIRRVYELRPRVVATTPTITPPGVGVMVAPIPEKLGQILLIYSPKGGTGASTLAVNLSIALAEETKEKVALVDGNLQFGDLGVLLNLRPDRTIADLSTQIEGLDIEMVETAMQPHPSGIRVLLAPPRPEMADLVTPEHVRRILSLLQRQYSFVVVDTWSLLHDLTLSVMDLAQKIILVITPDIPAIKNAKLFFDVIEALGYGAEKVMLILNRSNLRSAIPEQDIAASIKHPVAARIPNDEVAVLTASNQGVPLLTSQRGNPVSRGIQILAKQLKDEFALKIKAEAAGAARSPGLIRQTRP
ncbi:MAG: response regulator [Chloroflexi bacterium]|nr:response regulator [Chloroflexota bacterium]